MKDFKIVYLDLEGKKQSKTITCYAISSARSTFKTENKGKYVKIEYVLPLGDAKPPQ